MAFNLGGSILVIGSAFKKTQVLNYPPGFTVCMHAVDPRCMWGSVRAVGVTVFAS